MKESLMTCLHAVSQVVRLLWRQDAGVGHRILRCTDKISL